jgi:hypothetical protein
VIAAGSAAVASASSDSATQLCGRYQTSRVKNSRYVVMNNVWGATTAQCLEVRSDGAFRVADTDHRNADAAAAYPSIYAGCHWGNCTRGTNLPMRVDQLRSARSSWRTSTGAQGIWNAAYDIWFHTDADVNRSPDGAELMIWLDSAGGANPSGTVIARNVRLAGATWDIWYAKSTWNYVAYVRTTPTSSVRNLDLRAFIHDAVGRGYVKPAWYLSGVEGGFEIWRDGAGLESQAFSVTTTGGTTSLPIATRTAPPSHAARTAGPAPPARCSVRWSSNAWPNGLVAGVIVVNHGQPLDGWTVTWRFAADEGVGNDWGAEITQTGREVVARNAAYNSHMGTGASVTFGFQATHGGSPKRPAEFRLNGAPCTVG